MFFENYPRFYETSETSTGSGRLNLRYEAIFAENRDIFQGARVLDIASHDGRWSLAALATGASSVVGIEGRADLVDAAGQNLKTYGFDEGRFEFVAGDAVDVLLKRDFQFDVVMCLGFLYHTLRYNELLYGIRRSNPGHLIIDTQSKMMRLRGAAVRVRSEPAAREGNAVTDDFTVGDDVLVGQPNLAAIKVMLGAYGYEVERKSDWAGLIRDNPGLGGIRSYTTGNRVTLRCKDLRAQQPDSTAVA